jgi:O-antigen ligase
MASLGLRKDSASFTQLADEDILAVESGIPNHIYKNELSLYSIVYQMIWTIDMYVQGFNPSGHSVTQRIEYLKAASRIIRDNFWFGVGTGDVRKSFDEEYVKMNSQLAPEWRLRAHNQLVTFLLTFGIFGFIWVLAAIFLPVYLERKSVGFLFLIVFLAGLLSFINEDTLESQAGVTFFVYFYVLFLFGRSKDPAPEKGDLKS